ncbi:MAG: hypothetical protein WCB61_20980 [Pseudolabrys sp.]
MIKRMRVEPISTYLERYRKGGVAHPVTIANGFVYLSGLRSGKRRDQAATI